MVVFRRPRAGEPLCKTPFAAISPSMHFITIYIHKGLKTGPNKVCLICWWSDDSPRPRRLPRPWPKIPCVYYGLPGLLRNCRPIPMIVPLRGTQTCKEPPRIHVWHGPCGEKYHGMVRDARFRPCSTPSDRRSVCGGSCRHHQVIHGNSRPCCRPFLN